MMELEERYLTFKIKDVRNALSSNDVKILGDLIDKVEAYRSAAGKEPLECLCIEKDWPEYEPALAMLSARVDGKPNEAKVAELEKDAARYRFFREKVFFNEDGCYFAGSIWSALDKHNEAIKTDNAIDQAMKDSD